jgi:hypothetical protein
MTQYGTPMAKLSRSTHKLFAPCPVTRKSCEDLALSIRRMIDMAEAHSVRNNMGDWQPYFLWFPRRFDGKWHWRITMFRRKVWNEFDAWWEYSFLPLPGAPVLRRSV